MLTSLNTVDLSDGSMVLVPGADLEDTTTWRPYFQDFADGYEASDEAGSLEDEGLWWLKSTRFAGEMSACWLGAVGLSTGGQSYPQGRFAFLF